MTKLGDCFVRGCNRLHGVPAAALCILVFMAQSAIMDYYLIHHLSLFHLAWLAADVINLVLLLTCICLALVSMHDEKPRGEAMYSIAWISWLTMSSVVSAKTVVIFHHFSAELASQEPTFFGPNTLKTSIALGSCMFLLVLITQHNAPLGSESRRYIDELTGTVVFDLLDTVDILDILFEQDLQDMPWDGWREYILSVATLNLLLPTVPLLTLSRTRFGHEKLQKRLIYIHRLAVVLVVNIPNLLVRLILWHGFSVGISPFTLKNIILIAITFYEFYEHKMEKYQEHEREQNEMKHMEGKPSESFNNYYETEPRCRHPERRVDGVSSCNYHLEEIDDDNQPKWKDRSFSGQEDGSRFNVDFELEQRVATCL